ncbi:hypothetical protein DSECCO2_331050 [anaerobic digester metagenome]
MVRCTNPRVSRANFSHKSCEFFRTGICFKTEENVHIVGHISLRRSATVGSVAFIRAYPDGARQGGIRGSVQVEDPSLK